MDQFNEKGEYLEQGDLGKELLELTEKIDLVVKKVESDLDPTWSSFLETFKIDANRFTNSLRELAQDAYGEY